MVVFDFLELVRQRLMSFKAEISERYRERRTPSWTADCGRCKASESSRQADTLVRARHVSRPCDRCMLRAWPVPASWICVFAKYGEWVLWWLLIRENLVWNLCRRIVDFALCVDLTLSFYNLLSRIYTWWKISLKKWLP